MTYCNTLLDFNLIPNGKKTWEKFHKETRDEERIVQNTAAQGLGHSKDVGDLNQDFFLLLQSRVLDLSL